MPGVSTLYLKFGTTSGEKTWKLSNFDTTTTTQQVKTLMDTMITNGSIYKYPPLTKVSAKVQTVTESQYILD